MTSRDFQRYSARLEVDLSTLDDSRTVNYRDLLRSAISKNGKPAENGGISRDAEEADSAEGSHEQETIPKTTTTTNSDLPEKSLKPSSSRDGAISDDRSSPEIILLNKEPPSFPTGISWEVKDMVQNLIQSFVAARVSPRKFFALPSHAHLLYKLATALNKIGPIKKGLVHDYLAYYLPFKKKTLIVKMKTILKNQEAASVRESSLREPSASEEVPNSGLASSSSSLNKLPQESEAKNDGQAAKIETKTQPKVLSSPRKPDYRAIDFQSLKMTGKEAPKSSKHVAELKYYPLPDAFCMRNTPQGRERNELISMIKNVLSHYVPNRHNFFNCCLNPLFCALEDYIKPEFTQSRQIIYDHLAYYMPCSRDVLMIAVAKILEKKLCAGGPVKFFCEFEPSEKRNTKAGLQVDTSPAVHGNEERFKFSLEKHKCREHLRRKVDAIFESPNLFNEPSPEFRRRVIMTETAFPFEHFELRMRQKSYEFAQKCMLENQLVSPKTNCALPGRLTSQMQKILNRIKMLAPTIKHFNKDFYESPVLPALHELDISSRRYLKPAERRLMYEHLSFYFPCDVKNLLKLVDCLYEPHICFIMHYRNYRPTKKQVMKTGEPSHEADSKTDVPKICDGSGGLESKTPAAGPSKGAASERRGPKMPQSGSSSRSSFAKPEVEIFKVPQLVIESEATKDDSRTASDKIVSMLEDEQKIIEETNTAIDVLSQIFTDQDVVVEGWNETERTQVAASSSTDDHLQQLLQDLKDLKQLSTDRG